HRQGPRRAHHRVGRPARDPPRSPRTHLRRPRGLALQAQQHLELARAAARPAQRRDEEVSVTATARRAQFLRESVLTASPARLVTMLYDRLTLDLERAGAAAGEGDRSATAQHASHAQDILAELMSTLDLETWDGAANLFGLYTHLLTETMAATVS